MSLSHAEKTDLTRITWDLLIEADRTPPPLEADEKTAAMYAKETGKSIGWACSRLKQLVTEGKATRRPYGMHSWAYRLK